MFTNLSVRRSAVVIAAALFCALTAIAQTPAKLPPSTIKTIYITPTSHYDFGFVEPPDAVRERAARHIDAVLATAEANPSFRWTIESVWQLNEWLKRQRKPTSVLPKDKEKIGRLMKLIKSGRIMLSTSWGSMHTDFMGEEELNRLVYDYAKISRSYGVTSETALLDDVPGHPSVLPNILAGSDTKYLVTGANIFINQATSLAPGKVPFYWQSKDGSRVLTWVSQGRRGGYVEALTDFYLDPFSLDPYTDKTPFDMFNPQLAGKKTPLEVMEIGVTELLNRYNGAGYKYDAVMAMYAHDFIEPSDVLNLDKAVRLWNSKHRDVQLKIATPVEFFKYIESKYASQIPTFSGEWSGLWSEAKTQSPRISAAARYAHDHTPAAETLWSALAMTRKVPYPVGNFTALYDLMLTYDEHSGAGNNGWIQLNSREPLEEQNRQYVGFMNTATTEVDYMLGRGVGMIAERSRYDAEFREKDENTRRLVVFNGLSWTRSDVVRFTLPGAGVRVKAIAENGADKDIKFDIDEQGQVLFIAPDVPAFGYKTFEITTENGANSTTLKTSGGREGGENGYHVRLGADGNVESLTIGGRELVNTAGQRPFNSIVRVEGAEASRVEAPVAPRITVSNGKQMTQIRVERPRSVFPSTVFTIFESLGRVEVRNELDGAQMPFAGGSGNWHDSYYFAFPLKLANSKLTLLRGGQKWFDRLPDEYLPGARTDAVTTQHVVGLTDGAQTALIAHRQAFHWLPAGYVDTKVRGKDDAKGFPAMFTGKYPLPEATLYSRAVRRSNQADTHDLGVINMPTVEPGIDGNYVFEYAFGAQNMFDEVGAWRLGESFNVPLRAQFTNVSPATASESFFGVDQPNVQLVTVKSVSDSVVRGEVSASPLDPQLNKVYVIRLQEFAGKACDVTVRVPVAIKSATLLNLTESRELGKVAQIAPLRVAMKPFETKTIRIVID